mgnify:CR=1 FL=1
MARLLLIETATEVCSVGIAQQGRVLSVQEEGDGVNCSAQLTLLIEACLRAADLSLRHLDAVAVSSGPGSYTSLRVGVSTAKGICYALDKPLIAVPTLQALAAGARSQWPSSAPVRWVPMLDARRQEVWLAIFDEQLQPCCPAQPLVLDEHVLERLREMAPAPPHAQWVCAGNGTRKLSSALWGGYLIQSPINACTAAFLAELAEERYQNRLFEDVAYFEPFYMKPPHITQPKAVFPPRY